MITDSLKKLKQIKEDIKAAIIKKGGDVNDNFVSYAGSISKIPTDKFIVPEGMKFSQSTIEKFPENYLWSDSKN